MTAEQRKKADEKYRNYLQGEKWRKIATERLKIDKYSCQFCGCRGTKNNMLEIHHFSYRHLYNEENWIFEDLVTLCHCCHKQLHAVMNRITSPQGRRGWSDNATIPTIHIFDVGTGASHIEVRNEVER